MCVASVTQYHLLCNGCVRACSATSVSDSLQLYGPYVACQASVHGISQARILEWWPFPSPEDLPNTAIFPAQRSSLLCLLFWQKGSITPVLPGKPLQWLGLCYRCFSINLALVMPNCNVNLEDHSFREDLRKLKVETEQEGFQSSLA